MSIYERGDLLWYEWYCPDPTCYRHGQSFKFSTRGSERSFVVEIERLVEIHESMDHGLEVSV